MVNRHFWIFAIVYAVIMSVIMVIVSPWLGIGLHIILTPARWKLYGMIERGSEE